ncbi:MAG: hypothetical protein KJ771_01795 [Nanoarchaeota archaeon]|nr:hypothetical protein [Nanoarchaeota archaeon]
MDKKHGKNLFGFLVPPTRRGQGLSLNVIIVAAIALIVLVVLVMVFTGRIGIFESQIGGEAKSELTAMKTFYGSCHPGAGAETSFQVEYTLAAEKDDLSEAAQGKAEAKAEFQEEINNCKSYGDKSECDSNDCSWS